MPEGNTYPSRPGGIQGDEKLIIFTSTDTYNCTINEVKTLIGAEPAITKSTGYAKWTGSAWSFVNETYSLSTHDHSGVYSPVAHNHAGVYEPADPAIQSHLSNTSNPHGVTKTQVGLANVPDTDATNPANIVWTASYRTVTDIEKSTWNGKQDALVSGTNIKTINSQSILGSGNLTIETIYMSVRNETGSQITKGKVVYISGFNGIPLISLASNASYAASHYIGVVTANINHEANGTVIRLGEFSGVDTNSYSAVGADLYLSTSGNLVEAVPSSGYIIKVAEVMVKDNNGSLQIFEGGIDAKFIENNYAALTGATFTGQVTFTKITGGRIPRIQSIVSAASATINYDTNDLVKITALAEACTFNAPTGTPSDGQMIAVRIKDNGTPRSLTWNAAFTAMGIPLPSITTASKTMNLAFMYDSVVSKLGLVSLAQEE